MIYATLFSIILTPNFRYTLEIDLQIDRTRQMTKRESKWREKNERNLNLFFLVLSFKVTTYLLIVMMAHQLCEKSERNKKSESRAYTGKLCWENQSGSFNNCGCSLKAIFIWMHYYAKVKYLFILPKKMKGNKLC